MPSPILFVVVAASGAGKGVLLRSARDMGLQHVVVIPKVTTRGNRASDGADIKCLGCDLTPFDDEYDIIYGNYKAKYGISTSMIWSTLYKRLHALLICSNFASRNRDGSRIRYLNGEGKSYVMKNGKIPSRQYLDDAIPELYKRFGPQMKLLFLHSEITQKESGKHQKDIGSTDEEESQIRQLKIEIVRQYYVDNIGLFDHVLLNVRDPEDLSDQFFRLLQYYEGSIYAPDIP